MLNLALATIGGLAVLLAFVSKRIRDLPLSEPLLAMLLGIAVGPRVLGLIEFSESETMPVLLQVSRLLLAVSLMAIGMRYPLGRLRGRVRNTVLLLVVVMPGMAAVSALLGWWILGVPIATAWLIGACVAPTDPVLSSSVVTGESAEKLIPGRLRQLLSMESGSNDGLAFPLVVLGIVLVENESWSTFIRDSMWGVGGALLIGAAIGAVAGKAMDAAHDRSEMDPSVTVLFPVVLALLVLGVGKLAQTDAILGVFVAGLAYNLTVTGDERQPQQSIDDGMNRFLVLPMFTLFGVALPWDGWSEVGWPVLAFAVAVLVLRRPPLIALLRRPLDFNWPATAYYGWFGPIGASAVYYLAHSHEKGVTDPVVWSAGSLTIALSVVAHGVSAAPGRRRYAQHASTDEVHLGTAASADA